MFTRECGFYSLLLPLTESSAPLTLHRLHLEMHICLLLFVLGVLGSTFGNESLKPGKIIYFVCWSLITIVLRPEK